MTLWHLLSGMCFLVPLVAALDTATHAKSGPVGYLLAVGIGLVMGAAFTWIMSTTGRVVGARIKQRPVSQQEWYFRALYFAAVLWIVVVGFVAQRVLSATLRLVA